MRLIKLAIISFVVFFLLITGISLFFPSHVRISRATDIAAPVDSVHARISQPLNWKSWYPGADTLSLYEADGVIKGIRIEQYLTQVEIFPVGKCKNRNDGAGPGAPAKP